MSASASIWRPAIAVPRAGEVLQLRLAGVQLRSEARRARATIASAGRCDRDRAAEHEARPAAPGAVLGMAAVDEAAAVSPRTLLIRVAEDGQQRRQQRERREHRDGGDQHAADAHRAEQAAAALRSARAVRSRPSSRTRSPSAPRGSSSRRAPPRRPRPRAARRGSGRSSPARSRSRRRGRRARSGTGR